MGKEVNGRCRHPSHKRSFRPLATPGAFSWCVWCRQRTAGSPSRSSHSILSLMSTPSAQHPEPQQQQEYSIKCKLAERKIKEMIFLNAGLEEEVRECRQRVTEARADRQILLNKLLSFDKSLLTNGHAHDSSASNGHLPPFSSTTPAVGKKGGGGRGSRAAGPKSESSGGKRKKTDPQTPHSLPPSTTTTTAAVTTAASSSSSSKS